MNDWTPTVVIYHDPCKDGFTAAWAAWRRWPEALYVPAKYGQPLPPECSGARVLLVDFSYKRAQMEELAAAAESVVVLDHHKTALEELANFNLLMQPDYREVQGALDYWQRRNSALGLRNASKPSNVLVMLDMDHSGARLSWEFSHPGEPVPWLVRYVEDRDLWVYAHEHTRAIHIYLEAQDQVFSNWENIYEQLEGNASLVLTAGHALLGYYNKLVADMVASRFSIEIVLAGKQWRVPAVNCPGQFASDVGNGILLADANAPFSVCFSQMGGGTRYSLRSTDTRQDVAVLAASRGGGGHRNAAGFFEKG